MNKTRMAWLDDRLAELDKSKAGLADAMGIAPPRIAEIQRGARRVRLDEIEAMAHYLEWPEERLRELLSGKAASRISEQVVNEVLTNGGRKSGLPRGRRETIMQDTAATLAFEMLSALPPAKARAVIMEWFESLHKAEDDKSRPTRKA